jgi:hypothetical protein
LSSISVSDAQPMHRQARACHVAKHLPVSIRFGGTNGGPDVAHESAAEIGNLHVGVLGSDALTLHAARFMGSKRASAWPNGLRPGCLLQTIAIAHRALSQGTGQTDNSARPWLPGPHRYTAKV